MIWQQLFQNRILDRGIDYYNRRLVEDLHVGDEFIEGTVYGSKKYKVHIDMEDGEIVDMSCNCPYALEGNYCKHMAAVLFCVEYKNGAEAVTGMDSEMVPDKEESVEKMVKGADEVLIRNFLTGILKNDEKLLNRFRSALCCKISPVDMKRYKNQINEIFRKYSESHNFIDYYNAWPFVSELEEFLDNDIQGILENKQYEEAFELTNYIFVKIGNQDMDDSDGGTGVLCERCMEIWKEIFECCDEKLKKKMFRWYTEHLDGSVIDYMEEYMELILFENFKEDEFMAYKLKFTKDKASEYKEKDDWYNGEKWALRYIAVMQEQKKPQNIIDEYCKKNLKFSRVRKYYIENCIKRKEYDVAINLLEEGKTLDKGLPGLVADYSLWLKDLYKQLGNRQNYEKELWSLILKYRIGDVTIYKELKSLYTEEEWKEKREIIFKKLPPYAEIDKLYKTEKLYDRLLKAVLDSPGLYKLTEYEKCLKNIYPKELLGKYETAVKDMASYTSDRQKYREIVYILRRMEKYPGGKEKVEEIVTDWQSAYKNRRAMMDELKKL